MTFEQQQAATLALGKECWEDPTCGHGMRQGRPLTNVEMMALWHYGRKRTEELIAREGCCGDDMTADGRCPRTYWLCPLYVKARQIELKTFHPKPEDL